MKFGLIINKGRKTMNFKELYEDYLKECDADYGIENSEPMSYEEFVAQYKYEGVNL